MPSPPLHEGLVSLPTESDQDSSSGDAGLDDFDRELVGAAFSLAGASGWSNVTVAGAARAAHLSLATARHRFPQRSSILLRFNEQLDQVALIGSASEGSPRDLLFDLIMRRFDALQAHRLGTIALFRALPFNLDLFLTTTCMTHSSMRWILESIGVHCSGIRGAVQVEGLVAVWLYAIQAWRQDNSEDLSMTMAAVDVALHRAESVARWLSLPEDK